MGMTYSIVWLSSKKSVFILARKKNIHMRAFHLETIHFGEINTLRYMKLLGHCIDQPLTLGY